jgi:hypothetical protein
MERTVEIEVLDKMLMITALIYFDEELEYQSKYTQIIKVVDLEKNEGNLVPIKDEHYEMIEKHWEDNDVMEEL